MKTILKIITLLSLWFGFSTFAYSQTSPSVTQNSKQTIDSLKAEINALQKSEDNKSYTRIPNNDLENILDNKIQKSIRDILNWWLVVIGIITSVLGFLFVKYAKNYLQNIIDSRTALMESNNVENIKKTSNSYFSSAFNSFIDFKIEMIKKQDNKVDELIVNDLKNYLMDENITIDDEKKVLIIDTIMLCYFLTSYENKYGKMLGLIKDFEHKVTLLETTYANAAIALTDMYYSYGTNDYLHSAIEIFNKSIKRLPDYGDAFAQKLELYSLAISNAFDFEEKKHFETELLKVFKDIENNKSMNLCTGILNRFELDQKSYMKQYIAKLDTDYPEQMNKIRERVTPAVSGDGTIV